MKLVFFAALLLMLGACTKRNIEPTRQSRHTIDTLFNQKMMALQPEAERICDSMTPAIYARAIDSITLLRKQEMNILVE
jgi:hypothetical protein